LVSFRFIFLHGEIFELGLGFRNNSRSQMHIGFHIVRDLGTEVWDDALDSIL
jgi:hypothetical protein